MTTNEIDCDFLDGWRTAKENSLPAGSPPQADNQLYHMICVFLIDMIGLKPGQDSHVCFLSLGSLVRWCGGFHTLLFLISANTKNENPERKEKKMRNKQTKKTSTTKNKKKSKQSRAKWLPFLT